MILRGWGEQNIPQKAKTLNKLSFKKVNSKRYPAVNLIKKCLNSGYSTPIIVNASNEVLVGLFLCGFFLGSLSVSLIVFFPSLEFFGLLLDGDIFFQSFLFAVLACVAFFFWADIVRHQNLCDISSLILLYELRLSLLDHLHVCL